MGSKRSDLPMQVAQIARDDVVTAGRDASIREIAEAMFDQSVGSVVIIEDDDPVGIVTDRDLAVQLLAEDGPANLFKSDIELEALTAGDVMTTDPLVVDSDDELPRVLHHMTEAHARRIPVVDSDGSLAGILTLDDVVTHLAGESAHVAAQLDNVAGVIRSESPQG